MADQAALELAPGVRIAWDDLETARVAAGSEAQAAAWRLEGELAPSLSTLRVLTVATHDGGLLLLAGARPADAGGHDEENPQAVLIRPSGEVTAFEEALLSTQYGADGSVQRVGLELYAEGDDYPVRGAGDVQAASAAAEGPYRRESTRLAFRLDGETGSATLDVVRA